MSDEDITLVLKKRELVGKAVKGLRRDGFVPAVIHDHGKKSVHVMAPTIDMLKTYHQAGKHHPVNLTVNDQKYLALIKDADFDPKKRGLRHLVFNAIRQDEKVQAEVPIHLEGEMPAERAGLMVLKQLDHVTVEALPKDLVDSLKVNAEVLAEIGDKITVADLQVPAGVVVMDEPEQMIAMVEEPKVQEEPEAPAEEEGAESAEGGEGGEPTAGGEAGETKSTDGDDKAASQPAEKE